MTPTATVEAMYDAYIKGDLEGTFATLHPDILHTANETNEKAGLCGRFCGIDAVRARVAMIVENWEFESYEPFGLVSDGDRVAARVKIAGKNRHNGARLETVVAHFFVVEDGKITELAEFYDTALVDTVGAG